ncbi:MAG TPA: CcoQ/FixQ family Cbb3-type cytochrome c oxidase assembly chaperone [Ferruginibacter sp.]|nr:CcoQ/FixQ family Cbb3-type cytochrome c oxidase assembly chaperone [Ferruginibacter sp.]
MFKFIKQYAENMQGAEVYPIISLLIFFAFFIGLLYYVKNMDKKTTQQLSNIPLDQDAE